MSLVFKLRDVRKLRIAEGANFCLVVPQLDIAAGEKVALVGESGCGKSTLLDMLVMVLRPSSVNEFVFAPDGKVPLDVWLAWETSRWNVLSDLRKQYMGYVLQTGGLLPFLTVWDNINLSRQILSMPDDGTVRALAKTLGIRRQLNKLPGILSVGERQRVAIARALAHRPPIVLADEPTAAVDPVQAKKIMGVFLGLAEELGTTVIVASHNTQFVVQLGMRPVRQIFRPSKKKGVINSVFQG